MKTRIITLLFSFSFIFVFSQQAVVDENSIDFQEIGILILKAEEYKSSKKFDIAINYYEKAIEKFKNNYGKKHSYYTLFTFSLADLYRDTGRFQQAITLFTEILKNVEETFGKNHSLYGIRLNDLAGLYKSVGNYEKALKLYSASIENIKKTLGENDPKYGILLNNLGITYHISGQYKKAILTLKKALQNAEVTIGKKDLNYGIRLNNLALVYETIGEYEKATELINMALENTKFSQGKDHLYYGIRLNSLAGLYKVRGMYKKALFTYLEALEVIRKNISQDSSYYGYYSVTLNGLAVLYEAMGEFDKALPIYQESIKVIEEKLGKENPNYGYALNNLGALYSSMGQYEKALPLYTESLKSLEKILGKENLRHVSGLQNIALLYQSIDKPEKALKFLKESNKIILNEIKENFAYQTLKEKEKFTSNIINQGLKLYSSFNFLTNYSYSESVGSGLNDILISKGMLLKTSQNFLENLRSLRQDSVNKKIDSFISIRAKINREAKFNIEEKSKKTNQVKNVLTELEQDLVTIHSAYFGEGISYVKDFKKTKLKENELAIEFTRFKFYNKKWTDSTMYVAYLYKKDWETPKVVNLFEEKQLKKYITSSTSPNRLYASRGGKIVDKKGILADSIYNLVWKPLEPYVQNTSAIYYSPDGLLHKIPFSVLPNEENKLLGERYSLNQMGNTADIRKNSKLPNLNDVLLIGGVDYTYTIPDSKKDTVALESNFNILQSDQLLGDDDNKKRSSGGGSWEYLNGTATEIKAIKKLLPKSRLLSQKEATETAFKSLSGNSPSVLHIATHGYFFPDLKQKRDDLRLGNEKPYVYAENPLLRSGLILANANYAWKHGSNPYEEEDGILTALEISNLNLRNTDIVILSACETGLGYIPSSEGVYGLQRAFKMAGVETIIMTLWEVPDIETAEFMNLFYTQWKASNDPKKAFKETQKIMMNRYRNEPIKWAAFVYFE